MTSVPQPPTNSEQPPDAFTGPNGLPAVPIVLGIVGHCDVVDTDREILKARLVGLFGEFIKAYPHTPLLVVTSLAQGADQIAADAALEAGAFVRAPLPLPSDAFRASTSFNDEKAREHLDVLLKDSRVEHYVVPFPETLPEENDPEYWMHVATATEGSEKDRRWECYANAGGASGSTLSYLGRDLGRNDSRRSQAFGDRGVGQVQARRDASETLPLDGPRTAGLLGRTRPSDRDSNSPRRLVGCRWPDRLDFEGRGDVGLFAGGRCPVLLRALRVAWSDASRSPLHPIREKTSCLADRSSS